MSFPLFLEKSIPSKDTIINNDLDEKVDFREILTLPDTMPSSRIRGDGGDRFEELIASYSSVISRTKTPSLYIFDSLCNGVLPLKNREHR